MLTSAGANSSPESLGGMISSSSVDSIFSMSRLSSALPGATTAEPELPLLKIPADVSSLSFPLRLALSGPWQGKHFPARIGLMSSRKSAEPAPSPPTAGMDNAAKMKLNRRNKRMGSY